MNKSIMISVNPEHALNILQGKKTLELRKSVPKNYVGWVYMYVTKGKPYLYHIEEDNTWITDYKDKGSWGNVLNGSIVARWWHDEYENIPFIAQGKDWVFGGYYDIQPHDIPLKACVSMQELNAYGNGKDLYAWHIKQLEILSEIRTLNDFNLKRAPQSWCYIYE